MFAAAKKFAEKWNGILTPCLILAATFFTSIKDKHFEESYVKLHPVESTLIIYMGSLSWWILPLVGVMIFLLAIAAWLAKPTSDKLVAQNEDLKKKISFISEAVEDLFKGYLYNFFRSLNFGKVGNHERITLYVHDVANKRFIPCGRFSLNPDFERKGRSEYPDNQGCIGRAWRDGWHFVQLDKNETKRNEQHVRLYSLTANTTGNLTMPSVLYAALRITDFNGVNKGVLLVESTKQDNWDASRLQKKMTDQNSYICKMISSLLEYIPMPSTAADRGL